ncbi:MAG: PEP-CTERM sorting domain-containing protein [Rivularia sp. (in: Bacteria)]|nr:PEP-CTERM sorting domain-containing protein [Rivularia sp. MS3]
MKQFLKSLMAASATAIAILTVSSPAKAAVVTWNLNDVIFDDGGTASGSFQYDADNQQIGNFNIAVGSGSQLFGGTWVVPGFSGPSDGTGFALSNPAFNRFFQLSFVSPLTNTGGTIDLETDIGNGQFASFDANCGNTNCTLPSTTGRVVTAGSVTTEEVPEPLTIMGTVLAGGMGIAIKKKRAKKNIESA